MEKKNVILDLTLEFSLQIIDYCELLEKHQKYIIARQLLKSGTSIGANVREAQNAESKNDFIHKFKIAAKEADETEYWLTLCENSKNYPNFDENLGANLKSIQKIINSIIAKTKKSIS